MTQTYKYPDFVDRGNIDIIDGDIPNTSYRYRTVLIIPIKNETRNEGKVISFIMKNPSVADKNVCDKTISNVIHYVDRMTKMDNRFLGITEIRILNLYSIYSTDPSNLFDIINTVNNAEQLKEENNQKIKEFLVDTHVIVPAWGKKPDNVEGINNPYRDRALEVLTIIRDTPTTDNLFLIKYDKKRTLYPLHPERIGYKGDKIKKYMLHPYRIKGKMFVPK